MLIKQAISGAPVLDSHGRLVGILPERDCMQVAMRDIYHGTPGRLIGVISRRDVMRAMGKRYPL